ncbi:MAG: dTDP-4-dehydrorhamnose reductase [Chlamydiia bacterium]|nr:dTDP-4-dehydrorhamnose reductase [Chlamydiia bacterium]
MKNIWIVGKNGLLASAFVHICRMENISYISTSKNELDITDCAQVEEFLDQNEFSHVINCAAYTNVEAAEENKEDAYLLNETAVADLARACKERKIKLVHFSTDYVFSGRKLRPYHEDDQTAALNVYGESKLAGERALFSHLDDALLIRISWLFGSEGSSFVSKMKELMLKEKELRVIDDQIGKVSFAGDVAKATLNLLDKSGTFHFANRGILTWYEFAHEILDQLKRDGAPVVCEKLYPIKSSEYEQKVSRPLFSVLDTTKIENVLNCKLCGYKAALERCLKSL